MEMTRPEKAEATTIAVGTMRNALADIAQQHELNIAEAINAAAQVFTSVLVGAYRNTKEREVVIAALPDLIRAYIPQWEKIYAGVRRPDNQRDQ